MYFAKGFGAIVAAAIFVGAATAANEIGVGNIKSINTEDKSFVLKDGTNTDFTFKFSADLVVNREGKESKADLKVGDLIYVCYEKNTFSSTANYILVAQGAHKNSELLHGKIKSVDTEKKEVTITHDAKREVTYPLGKAPIRLNWDDAKMEDMKIGDHALLIVNTVESKATLQGVMITRTK